MEGDQPSPHGSTKHGSLRKVSSSNSSKDLWFITREGSLSELESALLLLKKNGGNINSRNAFGLTALHIATWRNNVPIVKSLLAAGADPDARDGESGWSSLHRALHFGHLAVASVLLQSGASLMLEDCKCRTPVDLISGPVLQTIGTGRETVITEVFSWGSGTNYQLGTGNAHIQKLPCKVDALQGTYIKLIASAKFHSVAVGDDGKLYSWGFGRGGRLGHPDFDIHSGQAAVITPRQVTVGLGLRQVKAVAVAKHHTVIATGNGEVFTWGSNREGQLGYTSVDSQPTPRRVSSLKSKIIAVAAANKHSAAVAESGEVFTWGCNKEGQLGYGTSNSASNYSPRLVEYLKGKSFMAISAAKYHTIVLSTDGEVYTWGHRLVTPKRVIITRNLRKCGTMPLKFHRTEKLHVISVAAGVIHSMALTEDGALFFWLSADPSLRCQQLYSMCGTKLVSISAGKYWTAAVTGTGDVFIWDGKNSKHESPIPTRLHGIKHATSVSVGETHLLAVCALYHPSLPLKIDMVPKCAGFEGDHELEELDMDFMFNDTESKPVGAQVEALDKQIIPSLKSLCEKTAIEFLLEPRNAVQLLEVADCLVADELRKHCEEIAIRNLGFIFTVAAPTISSASLDILANLEKALDSRSSESWSYRRLPTSTAIFPAVIGIEDEGFNRDGSFRLRNSHVEPMFKSHGNLTWDTFLHLNKDADQTITKEVRALRKKLQQIEILELKMSRGQPLDNQQIIKMQTRPTLENALAELGFPVEHSTAVLEVSEGKGNKEESSRRQRRKSKQKKAQAETLSANNNLESKPAKSLLEEKSFQIMEQKEDEETSMKGKLVETEDFSFQNPKRATMKFARFENTLEPIMTEKKRKKGGLSMFLSGALDDAPKEAPPPPKKDGPAWGGAKVSKGLTSLRDIQDEQTQTKGILPVTDKNQLEDLVVPHSSGHVCLSSFFPGTISSPIAISPSRKVPVSEGEKSTPPWSSTGTSALCRPSLRNIQIQQEKRLSESPKTRTMGFTVSSGQASSTSDTTMRPKETVPSRWFKPETDAPSSIRSIQIEEKAMKDLKRYYSDVKLVKAQNQGS